MFHEMNVGTLAEPIHPWLELQSHLDSIPTQLTYFTPAMGLSDTNKKLDTSILIFLNLRFQCALFYNLTCEYV